MKNTYVKPAIYMESFRMSDSIAGPCSIDVGFSDTAATKLCGYLDPSYGGKVRLFLDINNGVCDTVLDEGNDKGCYHIPIDSKKYFGS